MAIQRLDCPAMYLDMNPFENLWAELTRQLDSLEQQTTTLRQVRLALDTVPVQIWENFVNIHSHPLP